MTGPPDFVEATAILMAAGSILFLIIWVILEWIRA